MGGTIVGDSGPRTGEGAGSMSPEDRAKACPTVLILHSMPDETERIRALLERQPADLRVAHPQLENQTATNAFPITSKWSRIAEATDAFT